MKKIKEFLNISTHSKFEEDHKFYWRGWAYFGEGPELSIDFILFSKPTPSISFTRGSRSLTFHLAVPYIFSVWLKFGKILKYTNNKKELSISAHGDCIWLQLFTDPMDGKNHVFHWKDFLLGKSQYSTKEIETRNILVPMPEKSYEATAKLFESSWKRPRGFVKKITRVEIDIPGGIPHEGKGENSWDMGHDATFSMTTPAKTIALGVGNLVGSVLNSRVKYGGYSDWNWQK